MLCDIWNSPIGFSIPTPPGETLNIENLAFSPDSKKLAVGYTDGSIKLWKIQ